MHLRSTPRIICLCFAFLLLLPVRSAADLSSSSIPERDLTKPIIVGASDAFYPYSFVDHDGQLKGFAVDIVDAIAQKMGLTIQRKILTNTAIAGALQRREIDLTQFWSEIPSRRAFAEFSVPVARFESVIVTRKNDSKIKTLEDLHGRTIAVGQPGNVSDLFMKEKFPDATRIYTATTEDYLRRLASGEFDAAVMSHATAVTTIDRYQLKNLHALPIKITGYDVRYCFAVPKGDTLLLARLNEGMVIIQRSGEFHDIYQKWFGRHEPRQFTPVQVISYVALALALGCTFATWGFLRQRALNLRIARQSAELTAQRTLLDALHENLPIALIVLERTTDQRLRILSINHEAQRIHGLDPLTPTGTFLTDLTLTEDNRKYLDTLIALWPTQGKITHKEISLGKHQRLIDTTLVLLDATPDGASRLCLLSADITDKRISQIDADRTRRLRALGELVGGIAHEFNNLLTPILLKTNFLQADRSHDNALQEDLAIIDQAAQRASELTRRLLTFGRKGEDGPEYSLLEKVIQSSAALLHPTFDRRIIWKNSIPPGLPPVGLNTTDLNQIVFNLIINARDALMARIEAPTTDSTWRPQLSISVETLPADTHRLPENLRAAHPGDWQQLTVHDNGTGIAPDILERIFEPFFTTKEAGKGTGLGLSTVWHLTTGAGGHAYVTSSPALGTAFHILLPACVVTPQPAAPTQSTPTPRPAAPLAHHILIAEDEPSVAYTTCTILKRLGHTVDHALDGKAAWELFTANPTRYDLLLIDINMPHISGVELVSRIRKTTFNGAILIMSGRIAEPDVEQLRRLNVTHIMPKPFTIAQLQSAIQLASTPA